MTKLLSKCIATAIGEATTIALYLWIGWWTVLVFTIMPLFWAAGRWATERDRSEPSLSPPPPVLPPPKPPNAWQSVLPPRRRA